MNGVIINVLKDKLIIVRYILIIYVNNVKMDIYYIKNHV